MRVTQRLLALSIFLSLFISGQDKIILDSEAEYMGGIVKIADECILFITEDGLKDVPQKAPLGKIQTIINESDIVPEGESYVSTIDENEKRQQRELGIALIEAEAKTDAKIYVKNRKAFKKGFLIASLGSIAALILDPDTDLEIRSALYPAVFVAATSSTYQEFWSGNAIELANIRENELKEMGKPHDYIATYRSVYLKEIRAGILKKHLLGGAMSMGIVQVVWLVFGTPFGNMDIPM